MNWLRSLRRAPAPAPTPSQSVSRRRFFAGAGAVAGSAIFAGPAWAASEGLGIEPGTLVDAQGRPLNRAPMASEPFIAEVMMFGGNFAPRGWAFCDGQLLPINQYQAVFSLLGTTYGGNGQTTFALPDLRGRVPIHAGQGPGLSSVSLGQRAGQEAVTLTANEIPSHTHTLPEVQVRGTGTQVVGATQGGGLSRAAPTSATGGNQPHNNMPPYLAISFCIALEGIFPSRS